MVTATSQRSSATPQAARLGSSDHSATGRRWPRIRMDSSPASQILPARRYSSPTLQALLSTFIKPGGQSSRYSYDALGRLLTATDPSGATTTFARNGSNRSYTATITTALGRTTTYRVERLDTEDLRMTTI